MFGIPVGHSSRCNVPTGNFFEGGHNTAEWGKTMGLVSSWLLRWRFARDIGKVQLLVTLFIKLITSRENWMTHLLIGWFLKTHHADSIDSFYTKRTGQGLDGCWNCEICTANRIGQRQRSRQGEARGRGTGDPKEKPHSWKENQEA